MLTLIIVFNRITPPDFNIKNIPGTGNRIDVILRSILAVLNSNYYAYLKPQIVIVFEKYFSRAKTLFITPSSNLNIENEFSAALLFKKLLKTGFEPSGLPENIVVESLSFIEVIQSLKPIKKLYYMHRAGQPLSNNLLQNGNAGFILGDSEGLTENQEFFLETLGVGKLSLGPVEYLTSQCISLLQYYFCKNVLNIKN
ncbi:MAG: hypothetical protein OdinLCB4_001100 [Candidatus Odinarchaeum yellowstonii]|uniref:Uncharacterized protein n=1 Tax=Odinarchaeota yellowstonii (strain LCB_4) TaxID=1841599 RepID=A0AAF0ICI1_ODILC|nr:MAG: hypothetical protein OdinLCB4_001100 [Candidatus Odinarchaeum yellowstonii]